MKNNKEAKEKNIVDNQLDCKAEPVVFTWACVRSILDLLGLSWITDYYIAVIVFELLQSMNRRRRQQILRLSCHFICSKNARLTT